MMLVHEADRLAGGWDVFLVIDDTILPPQPSHPLCGQSLGLLRVGRALRLKAGHASAVTNGASGSVANFWSRPS